jgi:hypothetical protein
MEILKKNILVIIAVALPLVFIAGAVISTSLPQKPLTQYDFVYAVCEDSNDGRMYTKNECPAKLFEVKDRTLQVHDEKVTYRSNRYEVYYQYRLFLHDTLKDENREVTVEEAQNMRLLSKLDSPDGVIVESDYDNFEGDLFFRNSSQRRTYLTNGKKRQVIHVAGEVDYSSYDQSQFVGWVAK